MEEGTNSPRERAQDPLIGAEAPPADLAERAEAQAATEAASEAETEAATEAAAPTVISLDGRSPRAETCPFFRAVADDGVLGQPFEHAESANRCIAIGEPAPQSTRQQELVCLQEAHVNCPRYLRGSLGTVDPLAVPARVRPTLALPRATLVASGILVVSAIVSVGFVVARGGIDLPVAAVATASASPVTSPTDVALAPSPSPSPSPVVSPSPAPSPSPSPLPSPSPSPSPLPSIAPSPSPAPSATPTSDRYRLLDPCPDRPDCWIYTTRSGDNLYSIARYFGHSLETLYAWNPGLEGSALKPGRGIRMPPPRK